MCPRGVTAVLRSDVVLLGEGRKGLFLISLEYRSSIGGVLVCVCVCVSFWLSCSLVWSSVGSGMFANMTAEGVWEF